MADDFVTKFYLYSPGDPSVGIHSIETEMDLCFDVGEGEEREELRKQLKEFFSDLYDDNIGIEFEDERQKWIEQENKMLREQEEELLK